MLYVPGKIINLFPLFIVFLYRSPKQLDYMTEWFEAYILNGILTFSLSWNMIFELDSRIEWIIHVAKRATKLSAWKFSVTSSHPPSIFIHLFQFETFNDVKYIHQYPNTPES